MLRLTVGLRCEPDMVTVAVALPSWKDCGRGGASCARGKRDPGKYNALFQLPGKDGTLPSE